jgi:hypothetical protein
MNGLTLDRFRPRVLPFLTGTLAVAAAFAATGCSALGGTSASGNNVNAALAGSTTSASATATGMATPTGMAPTGMAPAGGGLMNVMAGRYQVLTLNDRRDLTFNQLLGINNEGAIAGYFGSGADAAHPNKGYQLQPPYAQGDFINRNFPGSAQTQVVGISDTGITVGFYVTAGGANIGFWRAGNRYHPVSFPTMNNAKPAFNQLLGVNDTGTAIGFYNDAAGNAHGYAYNLRTRRFKMINVPGATSLTATGINNLGTETGFYTTAGGATDSFVKFHRGRTITLVMPGASATQAFGLNDLGEVVGTYNVGTGDNAVTHGFTWMRGKFTTVDYPMASATFINGVNDEGDIVGFYTDAKGNTDGFFGLPS